MIRKISVFLICVMLALTGCSSKNTTSGNENTSFESNTVFNSSFESETFILTEAEKEIDSSASASTSVTPEKEDDKIKGSATVGVWISFTEINTMLKSSKGFKAEVDSAAQNMKTLSVTDVYVHIRSYCDSLFKSEYFPLIKAAEGIEYDPFKYMLDTFHKSGMRVHAWINPYRVLTASSDIEAISHESPAYKWAKDSDSNVRENVVIYGGIYLNPASSAARELVINGIRETIKKYDVDGIHFDDYFYPTTDAAFDSVSYEKYKKSTSKPLSLEDWRRANVNMLISGSYSAVKAIKKDIRFTVSPAADLNKNYNEFFADIHSWLSSGTVDAIIPQLYFGFEYPIDDFKFNTLLKKWLDLTENSSKVDLIIGLAPYKIGTDSAADKEEWGKDTDILSRQAEICYKNKRINGYIYFSYSSLFSNEPLNTSQRNSIKSFIKNCE